MYILGISAFYHDSAAALIDENAIIAAAQEERFSRKKHDASFPLNAVAYCLDYAGISINEIEAVVFYDKPLLKFERLLETYYAFAPKGLRSFLKSMPVWIKQKVFIKKVIQQELNALDEFDKKQLKIFFPEHHLSHAASAYYTSGFKESAILTIDGVGEWGTATIGEGAGNDITVHKQLNFPHSVGLLYSSFTWFLGFKVNSGEYKMMGLAPYGNENSKQVRDFTKKIKSEIVQIFNDGSVHLNQNYFRYATDLKMIDTTRWESLFGVDRRSQGEAIQLVHCNLALAIQKITEEVVIKMAQTAKDITGTSNLCMAGGVALNCVANGKLDEKSIFERIFIQPASSDAGGALGAALSYRHIYRDIPVKETEEIGSIDKMEGALLGPEYSNLTVEKMARSETAVYQKYDEKKDLFQTVTDKLSDGAVVGWMQGRMEFGPRALGNRSILADPRQDDMQHIVNRKIKFRESFRPFAPAILKEWVSGYFELEGESPYMLLVRKIREQHRANLPDDYDIWQLEQKLDFPKSTLPAVTHVDFSARIQTVDQHRNPIFWGLLDTFRKRTGCPALLNTSFNRKGEPIVCTPREAYQCFKATEMDYLVINDYLFSKNE